MVTNAERFQNKLEQAFASDPYNPEVNPFAGYVQTQRDEYVKNAMNAWQADSANAQRTVGEMQAQQQVFATQFDQEKLPEYAKRLSNQAAGVYSGDIDKEAIALDAQNMIGGLGSSAVAGLMAGDMLGGLGHHARVSALGFVAKIPGVGQLMTFLGSWLGALFGGKGLSWSEAGENIKKGKAVERLSGAYAQTANVPLMADMVEQVSKDEREGAPLAEIKNVTRGSSTPTIVPQPLLSEALPPEIQAQINSQSVQNDAPPAPTPPTPALDLPAPRNKLQELAKGEVIPGASGGDSANLENIFGPIYQPVAPPVESEAAPTKPR